MNIDSDESRLRNVLDCRVTEVYIAKICAYLYAYTGRSTTMTLLCFILHFPLSLFDIQQTMKVKVIKLSLCHCQTGRSRGREEQV